MVGAHLREGLRAIQETCEPLADVRGHGLFLALEWVKDRGSREPDPEGADVIVNRLRQAGFLLGRAGEQGNVLKIRPPLVFEQEHADLFLTAFEDAVARAPA